MPSRPDVELRLPAERAFAAVLRSTAASLAARLDFTVDDIDDLRLAVGETTTMLLEAARPATDLLVEYHLGDHEMTIDVSVEVAGSVEPDREGFAWQLLTALTTSLTADLQDGRLRIGLTMKSTPLE